MTTIKVSGMSCQGCVKGVTEVLQALDGVETVAVSLEAAQAEVSFDARKLNRQALCAAIDEAGFDAE